MARAKKASTLSVVDDPKSIGTYTSEDSGKYKAMITFETRGDLQVVGWHPKTDFSVTSTGGHEFEECDLSEGDWADYDEKADESVSITNFQFKVEASKK